MNTNTDNFADRLYLHDDGECYCYTHAPMSLKYEVESMRKFNGAIREIWTSRGCWSDVSRAYAKQMDEEFTRDWNLAPGQSSVMECDLCYSHLLLEKETQA